MAPQQKKPITIPESEQKNILALADFLDKKDKQPNILTREEFKVFAPIYNDPPEFGIDEQHLANSWQRDMELLELRFRQKIDYYKPTIIVRSKNDRTPLLILPAIHQTLNSLAPNKNNIDLVNRNTINARSDIEKLGADSHAAISHAFQRDQSDPEKMREFARNTMLTGELHKRFMALFPGAGTKTAEPSTPTPTKSSLKFSPDDMEEL